MQPIHTLVEILQDRGKRRLPLERMYRHLCREQVLIAAYAKIGPNDGSFTPGVDGQTVDGMSRDQVQRICQLLGNGEWKWKPVRRVHIPKKKGGTRPLGIPMTRSYCTPSHEGWEWNWLDEPVPADTRKPG